MNILPIVITFKWNRQVLNGKSPDCNGTDGQAVYFCCCCCLEPICAIGMGVAGLFSATNKDGSWKFKGYSMTSVSFVTIYCR